MTSPTPKDEYGLFTVVPADYPARERYQADLLEQYKLYVEMADRVSGRRLTTNSYFLSINSALLAFAGYVTSKQANDHLWLVGCAGIVLSILWYNIVTSYRDLNTAKFKIIHEMEKRLPLTPFAAEWNAMGRGQVPTLYRPLSHIERVVPWVFVALHVYVVVRSFTA